MTINKHTNSIVVLASGNGSNFQAIVDACHHGVIHGHVSALLCNNANAFALERARCANIPAHLIEPKHYADRQQFELALIDILDRYQPKLIVLAGYMLILSPLFVQRYLGRLINIHPSLLPKYPGLHTHRKVLQNRDKTHGSTVHFVTEELDGGPIIWQEHFIVMPNDTEDSLIEKIKQLEHLIYPIAIEKILQNTRYLAGNLIK